MTPPLEDLTIEEKRLIASMEAEARFYQQIAGFYEKLTVLSMSSIAGAMPLPALFLQS